MTALPRTLRIGGTSPELLREELTTAGVELNAFAETLLGHPEVAEVAPETITLTRRTVGELGLAGGGTLSQVITAAQQQGLDLCPAATGPHLRLVLTDQAPAPDSVLSAGRAPCGALHVLSAPLSEDHEYPKGFYLRVVDGVSWLRGYRCDDEYVVPAESTMVLRVPPGGGAAPAR